MPVGVYKRTKESNKKGLTMEQYYGEEKAKEIKQKIRLTTIKNIKDGIKINKCQCANKTYIEYFGEEKAKEIKKKKSKSMIGRLVGYVHSENSRKNMSIAHLGQIPWNKDKNNEQSYGEERAKEINEKNKQSALLRWKDPIYREKVTKAILEGLMQRPSSFEKIISDLCIENSLPFIYTGDGRILINFKNPDFICEEKKIVIEVFWSWFKIRDYGSIENYKEFCRQKYNSAGWKVIFIDENEIDNKELCLKKIKSYL
jgi:hypothetical protein